jgi:hypothetical protein
MIHAKRYGVAKERILRENAPLSPRVALQQNMCQALSTLNQSYLVPLADKACFGHRKCPRCSRLGHRFFQLSCCDFCLLRLDGAQSATRRLWIAASRRSNAKMCAKVLRTETVTPKKCEFFFLRLR